ncbi:hypothetical protein ACFZC6_42435 [Streptomyces ossamyceticus]|uniref:hypothetical protein n=1 Tax=Streptomyces ossamyceticus TaxID=249581 RepID=UPI0036E0964F
MTGRSAVQVFVEFSTPFPNFIPEHREHQAMVECKLGHKKQWAELLKFPLQLGNITSPATYIAYSNEPDAVTAKGRAAASAALYSLRSEPNPKPNPN